MGKRYFTSESVTEGHPDKICDAISDGVLDAILTTDPNARVACEVACTTGLVLVMGEITTETYVDIQKLTRTIIKDIGYTNADYGFDSETCAVLTAIDEQSPDIALGVDASLESKQSNLDVLDIGAGDQGMVFGYASDETEELMPLPIVLAHKLARRLAHLRKAGLLQYLRPDGKTQVTVEYEDDKPVRVDTIVISTQHDPDVAQDIIEADMIEHVILATIPFGLLDKNTTYLINPTGKFVVGGPHGDSGLTGRKIIVDTYGGMCRHGGGAFSGKDPTKTDRSGAYAARYVAKNIVAAGLAKRVEIQLAYAIGVARPISILVETFGTGTVSNDEILRRVNKVFDLRPAAIIEMLDLRRPIYRQTASYGHFGRLDLDLPWERTDKAGELKNCK